MELDVTLQFYVMRATNLNNVPIIMSSELQSEYEEIFQEDVCERFSECKWTMYC